VKKPNRDPKACGLRALKYLKFGRPDSFVLSHPKAGRTWLRAAMSKAVSLEYDLDESYYFRREPQLSLKIPYLKFTHGGSESISRGENLSTFNNKRVVFLTRDLLDVQVSYYHQITKRRRRYSGPLSAFIRDERYGMKKIVAYHNNIISSKDSFAGYLQISYEEMHDDLITVLERCFQFLGVPVCRRNLEQAKSFSEFSKMRKRERKSSVDTQLDGADIESADALKSRKGRIHGYADEMTALDIEYCRKQISDHLTVSL
jgi:hypothetical protein